MRRIHTELGTDDLLHRFFSPQEVPEGLTESEKRICIRLYPRLMDKRKKTASIRKKEVYNKWLAEFEKDYTLLEYYRENFSRLLGEAAFRMSPESIAELISGADYVVHQPLGLPPELLQTPMSRETFSLGIRILTDTLNRNNH